MLGDFGGGDSREEKLSPTETSAETEEGRTPGKAGIL